MTINMKNENTFAVTQNNAVHKYKV